MTDKAGTDADLPVRPDRLIETPVPPVPHPDHSNADAASTEYSAYRTGLSHHRTGLSEHRTDLSEYRTDLSTHRTDLSTSRTEMSMRRTGMSFQRTRMSADRTLMSVIRTALSLIGFGFTIYQAFARLRDAGVIHQTSSARNLGMTLIALGIVLLVGGIARHIQFANELRRLRLGMKRDRLIHAESSFPISITLIVAVLLMVAGLVAIVNIAMEVGSPS